MTDRIDVVDTGSEMLDRMLGGGLPARRATLVTGGPGAGKSTFGMQFLHAGVEAGETGLYVSTEQTIDEIRQSFAGFEFDLDDPGVNVTTLHATPGQTIESDDALTLQQFGAETESPLGKFGIPFTIEYIQDHLREEAPVDRVVFDSTSGLKALADDAGRYRRLVLDLIRFFTDELEATTILTAEESNHTAVETDLLQFTTHGVVQLGYDRVNGDRHRSLEILKMRGLDHDHRRVEVQLTAEGLRLGPTRRSQPPALKTHSHQPIGIPGLDALAGGGLVTGAGVLFQHDGRTQMNAFFGQLFAQAIETGRRILLVPTLELRQSRLRSLCRRYGADLQTLLESGHLQVIDLIGSWDSSLSSVTSQPATVNEYLEAVEDVCSEELIGLINANAVIHTYGAEAARKTRYFTEANAIGKSDMLIDLLNHNGVGDEIAAFYMDAAEQVLRTWMSDAGLQYLTLEKSPCGFVGTTSLVEYTTSPPYLQVQQPPQTRENPYAEPLE